MGLQFKGRGGAFVRFLSAALLGVLCSAGDGAAQTGARADALLDSLHAARTALVASGDSGALAATMNEIGLHFLRVGRYDSALAYQQEVRAIREALGDTIGIARAHNAIGVTFYQSAHYENALENFLRAADLWRGVGAEIGVAFALNNIGKTYQDWGQRERARAAFDEAFAIGEAQRDAALIGYTLNNLGVLHRQLGEFARARELLERSLAIYTGAVDASISDPASGVSLNVSELGLLASLEGDHERAVDLLTADLRAAELNAHPRREVRALLYLGRAHKRSGDLPAAAHFLERALAVAAPIGQRAQANEARAALADVHEAIGDTDAALAYMRAFNSARDSIFDQAAGLRIAAMEARNETARSERDNAALRVRQEIHEATIARQWVAFGLGGALLIVSLAFAAVLVRSNRLRQRRNEQLALANAAIEETNLELQAALAEVRTLSGFIPICASCKKVRNDRGYWEQVETYIANRSEATFSHGICSDCGPDLYGDDWQEPPAAERGGVRADTMPARPAKDGDAAA